jgi:methionyl aminopeptidase
MRRLPQRRPEDIAAMRRAGQVVARMHQAIRESAQPGVTTRELDTVAREVLASARATSNFLGYHGFPAVICTSINEQVIHGIPGDRVLADGDLLSVDCGAIVDGWHGDAAFSMVIGTSTDDQDRLIETADRALAAAIGAMRPGNHVGDLGLAIDRVVSAAGYGSPRDYCGHGIGRAMHEDPDVPNRGRRGRGPALVAGSVLAIEPMLIAGGDDHVVELDDGWTIVTADGSLAAHVEHTVLVTSSGAEILTRL